MDVGAVSCLPLLLLPDTFSFLPDFRSANRNGTSRFFKFGNIVSLDVDRNLDTEDFYRSTGFIGNIGGMCLIFVHFLMEQRMIKWDLFLREYAYR